MYIQNAYYKAIPVTGATFPLAAGTIVTANGTVPASADQYFGIVPEKVDKMPTTGYIFVAVSGTIDLDTCGVTFTDAQIKALGADFNFVRAKEEHEPPAPELPAVDSGDNGKILKVVSGEWAAAAAPAPAGLLVTMTWNGDFTAATLDKTYAEINQSVSSGVMPVIIQADAGLVFALMAMFYQSDAYHVVLYDFSEGEQFDFNANTEDGTLTFTAGT